MDAIEFNRKLDSQLSSKGEVNKELFAQLMDAYTYAAAPTVGWVEAKLRVLKHRINNGGVIYLYEPLQSESVVVTGENEFFTWVNRQLPAAWPKT